MKLISKLLFVLPALMVSLSAHSITEIGVKLIIAEPSYKELVESSELQAMEQRGSQMIAEALGRKFKHFGFNVNTDSNSRTLIVTLNRMVQNSIDDIQPLNLYWSWSGGIVDAAKWNFYSSAEFFDLDYEAESFYLRLTQVLHKGNYQLLQEKLLVDVPVTQQGAYMPDKSGAKPGWLLGYSHMDLCLHPDSTLMVNSKWLETRRTLEADVVIPENYEDRIFGEIRDISILSQISGIDPNTLKPSDNHFIEAYVLRYSPLVECGDPAIGTDQDVSPLMVAR